MIISKNIRYHLIFNLIIMLILLSSVLYFINNLIINLSENTQNVEVLNGPIVRESRLHQIDDDKLESELQGYIKNLNFSKNVNLSLMVSTKWFVRNLVLLNSIHLNSTVLIHTTTQNEYDVFQVSPMLVTLSSGYSECKVFGLKNGSSYFFESDDIKMNTTGITCYIELKRSILVRVRLCDTVTKVIKVYSTSLSKSFKTHDGDVSCKITYSYANCYSHPYEYLLSTEYVSDNIYFEYFCDDCSNNLTETLLFGLGYNYYLNISQINFTSKVQTEMKILNVYTKTTFTILNDSLAGPLTLLSLIGFIKLISKRFVIEDTLQDSKESIEITENKI